MKVIFTIIAVLFIPFCFTEFVELLKIISRLSIINNIYFFIGGILYLFIHFYLSKFTKIFIYQHELTHGFFALLFGGDVKKINVNDNGGSVNVTKPNYFVAIAPYIFPLYAFLIILFYYTLQAFNLSVFEKFRNIILLIFGFSIFFHFLFTYISLKNEQSDLRKNGYFFSLTIIFILNIIIIILILKFINPSNVSLKIFFSNWIRNGWKIYFTLINFFVEKIFSKQIII